MKTRKNKNSTLRSITVLMMIVALFATMIIGCSKEPAQETGAPVDNGGVTAKLAEDFIAALIGKDYDTARELLGAAAEGSFVSAAEIGDCVSRSAYSGVDKVNFGDCTYTVDETMYDSAVTAIVTVSGKNKENTENYSFTVKMLQDSEGNWYVKGDEFITRNYSFRTPGGDTKVEVNGQPLSDDYLTNTAAGGSGMAKEYTIPVVGRNAVNVRVYSENFDYATTLLPFANNAIREEDFVYPFLDEEQIASALEYVKRFWADSIAFTHSGEDNAVDKEAGAEMLKPYISSAAAENVLSDLVEIASEVNNTDIQMTQCLPHQDYKSPWITDDSVSLYFKYELAFKNNLGLTVNQRDYGTLYLKKEAGEWKILELADPRLWTFIDEFTQRWQ